MGALPFDPIRLGSPILVAAVLILAPSPATAGYSPDEPPTETVLDPGDLFLVGGALEVDDGPCPPPPVPAPCLGVPDDDNFDMDGFSVDVASEVCPDNALHVPGILFSIDDGDPGAHSATPHRAMELFFYDRCGLFGGGSFLTNGTESLLGLGSDPLPPSADDDVDAYEARSVATHWESAGRVLFTPDTPSSGALPASLACGSSPESNIYVSDAAGGLGGIFATPCDLGVPAIDDCDIDAISVVTAEQVIPARGLQKQILFSTDANHPCGLDPGDIYISDLAGNMALWADDVTDLRIADGEDDRVDVDAISVNAPGPITPGDTPFEPDPRIFKKTSYPDYAPSGVPDFSQQRNAFPPTYCGPTAVADCFWWFDSKFEGGCPGGSPGDGADDFPLVRAIPPATDDHAPANVERLIGELATPTYLNTDGGAPGTLFGDMVTGVDAWLAHAGLLDDFTRTARLDPTFEEIACEVERSENVILLLGFWWFQPLGGTWFHCGGHYVTVAGVQVTRDPGADGQPGIAGFDDDGDSKIDERDELCPCGSPGAGFIVYGDDVCGGGAFDRLMVSDPGKNNAEPPTSGPGQVLGPAHANHAPTLAPPPDHDDARNVSHDLYDVAPALSGSNAIALSGYGVSTPGGITDCIEIAQWCEQNPTTDEDFLVPCTPGAPVSVEVEAMLAISPVVCDLCLDAQGGPTQFLLHKGACPSPASHPNTFDYIRGELCQLTESAIEVNLGDVACLQSDTAIDQWRDTTTPALTTAIGAHFFLVREDPPNTHYGLSSQGNPRFAAGGDCP